MMVSSSNPKPETEGRGQSSGDAEQAKGGSEPRNDDVALINGRSADGQGLTILRTRRGRLEFGEVRPLTPGKPILGEVVHLKPRKKFPLLCDVETQLEAPPQLRESTPKNSSARSGPPQVASEDYRRNWDAIYQSKKKQPLLN
jgi:hypothetical protein